MNKYITLTLISSSFFSSKYCLFSGLLWDFPCCICVWNEFISKSDFDTVLILFSYVKCILTSDEV